MEIKHLLLFHALCHIALEVQTLHCQLLIADDEIKQTSWSNLKCCLSEFNDDSEGINRNISIKIWHLVKAAFGGIKFIPPETFQKLRYILTVIPEIELSDISMERVEVVEAFGAVRNTNNSKGFSNSQLRLLAGKLRNEWVKKQPSTYSAYDLMSMGEILCHLNVLDIEDIHADAYRDAAESIGQIEKCPLPHLQAIAALAIRDDAFGKTSKWSKLDVSLVGNVINGLRQDDVQAIDKHKLQLNRYYIAQPTRHVSFFSTFPDTENKDIDINTDIRNDSASNKTLSN